MKQELFDQAKVLYQKPLIDLIYESHTIHRQHHDPADIQKCTLLSIKTGGCPENCSYCPQSVHYQTGVDKEPLMAVGEVLTKARQAKEDGATRFCMGVAWRSVKNGPEFDRILEMVKAVRDEGLEVCVTMGMLNPDQAKQLKNAGVYAYNHNLDSSREFYSKIISTRTYDDRLETLKNVRDAGITVCCGGIIGMGESIEDRCGLIAEIASLNPQPESVPINLLVPIDGTPLADQPPVDPLDFVRMIAIARILVPKARVRLSAGRLSMSRETQFLAFFAGANSIHYGDKLLTQPNNDVSEDNAMVQSLAGSAVAA
jgi:biotin synthase